MNSAGWGGGTKSPNSILSKEAAHYRPLSTMGSVITDYSYLA